MLKIVALKHLILFSFLNLPTTSTIAAFVPAQNLVTPAQVLENFLLPIREYLFTRSHRAIRITSSPAHHRWELASLNNIIHWTRTQESRADEHNFIFAIYSEKTQHNLQFKLNYSGSETLPFDLVSFQTMHWPQVAPKQAVTIAWPTPEFFQTRWQVIDREHWQSRWSAPSYGIDLSLQRSGELYIYRCSMCLRQPNGPTAIEAKVLVAPERLFPRYFLEGQEVSANLFNQWINEVFLFSIKQSAEMFVHFLLAPNIFDEQDGDHP